jgi:hypothetical protein
VRVILSAAIIKSKSRECNAARGDVVILVICFPPKSPSYSKLYRLVRFLFSSSSSIRFFFPVLFPRRSGWKSLAAWAKCWQMELVISPLDTDRDTHPATIVGRNNNNNGLSCQPSSHPASLSIVFHFLFLSQVKRGGGGSKRVLVLRRWAFLAVSIYRLHQKNL